jgi:hypothetical protein
LAPPRPLPQGEVCERLLRQAFEATQVSRRLFSFHAAFLHLVARPPCSSIEQVGGPLVADTDIM